MYLISDCKTCFRSRRAVPNRLHARLEEDLHLQLQLRQALARRGQDGGGRLALSAARRVPAVRIPRAEPGPKGRLGERSDQSLLVFDQTEL